MGLTGFSGCKRRYPRKACWLSVVQVLSFSRTMYDMEMLDEFRFKDLRESSTIV